MKNNIILLLLLVLSEFYYFQIVHRVDFERMDFKIGWEKEKARQILKS